MGDHGNPAGLPRRMEGSPTIFVSIPAGLTREWKQMLWESREYKIFYEIPAEM